MTMRAMIATATMLALLAAGAAAAEPSTRVDEGKVEAIEMIRAPDDGPLNAGTVVGGIAGGVIGHQIGSGRGNAAATIAGTIGGAVVGNEIHKKHAQATRYRIVVRLDDGGTLVLEDTHDANLRVGDRVRVEGNRIQRI
jgi:outer membrane lipoprotein SlyB